MKKRIIFLFLILSFCVAAFMACSFGGSNSVPPYEPDPHDPYVPGDVVFGSIKEFDSGFFSDGDELNFFQVNRKIFLFSKKHVPSEIFSLSVDDEIVSVFYDVVALWEYQLGIDGVFLYSIEYEGIESPGLIFYSYKTSSFNILYDFGYWYGFESMTFGMFFISSDLSYSSNFKINYYEYLSESVFSSSVSFFSFNLPYSFIEYDGVFYFSYTNVSLGFFVYSFDKADKKFVRLYNNTIVYYTYVFKEFYFFSSLNYIDYLNMKTFEIKRVEGFGSNFDTFYTLPKNSLGYDNNLLITSSFNSSAILVFRAYSESFSVIYDDGYNYDTFYTVPTVGVDGLERPDIGQGEILTLIAGTGSKSYNILAVYGAYGDFYIEPIFDKSNDFIFFETVGDVVLAFFNNAVFNVVKIYLPGHTFFGSVSIATVRARFIEYAVVAGSFVFITSEKFPGILFYDYAADELRWLYEYGSFYEGYWLAGDFIFFRHFNEGTYSFDLFYYNLVKRSFGFVFKQYILDFDVVEIDKNIYIVSNSYGVYNFTKSLTVSNDSGKFYRGFVFSSARIFDIKLSQYRVLDVPCDYFHYFGDVVIGVSDRGFFFCDFKV